MKRLFAVLLLTACTAYGNEDSIIEWDPSLGADGYKVYRKFEKCDAPNPTAQWELLVDVGSATVYTDPGLPWGTKVCYYAVAYNEGGESLPSNTDGKVIKPDRPGNFRNTK